MQEWQKVLKHNPADFGETSPQIIEDFTLRYNTDVTISDPKDLVTKEYVDANSGGTGSEFIGTPTDGTYNDGLLDLTPTTKISDATDDINEILTELAPIDAETLQNKNLSIFNNSTTLYSGYLSNNNSATYKTGELAGSLVNYIVKNTPFVLQTSNTTVAINKGDIGTLKLYINDVLVDTFNLATNFNEAYRNSSQVYTLNGGGTNYNSPNNFISIIDVSKYNNFKKWQKCIARININSSNLISGYNKIILKHEDIPTPQTSNIWELFYDNDLSTIAIDSYSIAINNNTSNKYLSGVKYLGLNDNISLNTVLTNLFKNTYLSNPISYSGFTGITNNSITINDSSISGISSPPSIDDVLTITNKILTLNVNNVCSQNARLTLNVSDPYNTTSTLQSTSQNILVNTYQDGISGISTDKTEYFTDEYYRLPLNFDSNNKTIPVTNLWDSKLVLENGNAQFYMINNVPALIYPSVDFNTCLPTQNVNYSGFSGLQKFMRCFISSNSQSSVTLQLDGILSGIGVLGTGDINIEIKLPTQTGWLDIAKPYNSSAGVENDGNGCLNGSINYTGGNAIITATFGGKSTYDSNYKMLIRITLLNNTKQIKKINCTSW